MYLLVYSILIGSALILAIFLVTYLTDKQFFRKQNSAAGKKSSEATEPGMKANVAVAPGYMENLSIGIQEF